MDSITSNKRRIRRTANTVKGNTKKNGQNRMIAARFDSRFSFSFKKAVFVIIGWYFSVPLRIDPSDMHTYALFFQCAFIFFSPCAHYHFKLGIQSDLVHWFHIDLCLAVMCLSIACQKLTEQVFFPHVVQFAFYRPI